MADWVDVSVKQQEDVLAAQTRARKEAGPEATGCCLFCGARLPRRKEPRRWCNSDCRDDWQREQNLARQRVR